MNRVRLVHVTEFQYDGPVSESYNEVHLRPRDDERQSCLSFRLITRPPSHPAAYRDYFGNWVHRFNVLPPHRTLRIEAESVVMVHETPATGERGGRLADLAGQQAELATEHHDFLAPSVYVPHADAVAPLVAAAEAEAGGQAVAFVLATARLIHTRFRYERGATHVHSSVADVLRAGAGVCQDFTHLLLAVMRRRGLPGRYVSGYLVPAERTPRKSGNVEEVSGGQASHAWAEVFVPGVGWLGVDPTLGRLAGEAHVRLAHGRDYADVPPVRGVYNGQAGQRLSVGVGARPALDDEGCEYLRESAAARVEPSPPVGAPQQ
jgi:transglutaminase-like putative cysteine protease